ncbi:hypothetical protein DRO_1565 [Deinococcus radiodurans R1 = ATCC 13939 = DSM 20539]|jgi:hypothetical protein|nr:hypothetical protein A2G07_05655 [Deinococcus radiodurans R1 = ATCC 13939 = DSM 20539]UID70561.1 hypothetical protein DRO_1565 [Deinococcus radiodurans R1 = ATCC 13939 = DSM 20539]
MFRRRAVAAPLPLLAELRDVDSPSAAARVGAEFGGEPHFAKDLQRVRPWLPPELTGAALLDAIRREEWTGFLALLAEDGPWVYVQNVREVQVLSRLYSRLARAAGQGPGARGEGLGVKASAELSALEAEFWEVTAVFAAEQRGRWAAQRRG